MQQLDDGGQVVRRPDVMRWAIVFIGTVVGDGGGAGHGGHWGSGGLMRRAVPTITQNTIECGAADGNGGSIQHPAQIEQPVENNGV